MIITDEVFDKCISYTKCVEKCLYTFIKTHVKAKTNFDDDCLEISIEYYTKDGSRYFLYRDSNWIARCTEDNVDAGWIAWRAAREFKKFVEKHIFRENPNW